MILGLWLLKCSHLKKCVFKLSFYPIPMLLSLSSSILKIYWIHDPMFSNCIACILQAACMWISCFNSIVFSLLWYGASLESSHACCLLVCLVCVLLPLTILWLQCFIGLRFSCHFRSNNKKQPLFHWRYLCFALISSCHCQPFIACLFLGFSCSVGLWW